MLTQTVDVHEAQKRLLELLGAVTAGTEVTLTKGSKPIARLVPIAPAAAPACGRTARWGHLGQRGF